MALITGDFQGKAVKAECGANPKSGKPETRITMQVAEGEHKGKTFQYSGKLDEKNIKYTKAAMIAIGWQGKDVRTFIADVAKADKTVGFSVDVARWEKDDGTIKEWSAVRSIGYAAPPLEAFAEDKVANVNSWFAEAGDVGAQQNGAAPDDLPF